MADELTTQPMLEALLEGQRQLALRMTELGAQMSEMRNAIAAISDNQDTLSAKQDALSAKQDALAARQEDLATRQDRLEVAVIELTREVRDGFDDATRKIDVLNSRLLTFETRLKRVDDRLHDEILARTR